MLNALVLRCKRGGRNGNSLVFDEASLSNIEVLEERSRIRRKRKFGFRPSSYKRERRVNRRQRKLGRGDRRCR